MEGIKNWYKDKLGKWHHFIETKSKYYLDGEIDKNPLKTMYEYGLYKFSIGGDPNDYIN